VKKNDTQSGEGMRAVFDAQRSLLEILARTEEQIAQLYALYAEKFPKDSAFWLQMSSVEELHARLIRSLKDVHERGHVIYRLEAFNEELAVGMQNQLTRHLRDAREIGLHRRMALATAVGIESSLIERGFFENAASEDQAFERVAQIMHRHCEQHRRVLQERLHSVISE